jgi:Uma2 family endonuclease
MTPVVYEGFWGKPGPYTFKDCQEFDDEKLYELLNGYAFLKDYPNTQHQRISTFITVEIANYLAGKQCEVFASPYGVALDRRNNNIMDSKTVVLPDISIICDKYMLTKAGCFGPPDFICEIVSSLSQVVDYAVKTALYGLYGVKEYWIVDMVREKQILKYVQEKKGFYSNLTKHDFTDRIKIEVLEDCYIDFSQLAVDEQLL